MSHAGEACATGEKFAAGATHRDEQFSCKSAGLRRFYLACPIGVSGGHKATCREFLILHPKYAPNKSSHGCGWPETAPKPHVTEHTASLQIGFTLDNWTRVRKGLLPQCTERGQAQTRQVQNQ